MTKTKSKKPATKKKVSKTKGKKTATKPKIIPIEEWTPNEELNPNEELFCRYYAQHAETRNKATISYALAYGYDLEGASKDDAVYEEWEDEKGNLRQGKCIQPSSYDRMYSSCASLANRLLKKVKIVTRVRTLIRELLSDDFVDTELAKVIAQDEELHPKVQAIKEYNAIGQRVVQKHEHSFSRFESMSSDELEREIAKADKFFKKK